MTPLYAKRGWTRRFYPLFYAIAEILTLPALLVVAYLAVVFFAAALDVPLK